MTGQKNVAKGENNKLCGKFWVLKLEFLLHYGIYQLSKINNNWNKAKKNSPEQRLQNKLFQCYSGSFGFCYIRLYNYPSQLFHVSILKSISLFGMDSHPEVGIVGKQTNKNKKMKYPFLLKCEYKMN